MRWYCLSIRKPTLASLTDRELRAKFFVEPGSCEGPASVGSRPGDVQYLSGLRNLQADEAAELYELGHLRVLDSQLVDGCAQGEQPIVVLRVDRDFYVLDVDSLLLAAVTHRAALPGAIDQDVAHRFRCSGQEMSATLPARTFG